MGQADAAAPAQSSTPSATSMQDMAAKAFASHCVQCHSLFGTEGFSRLTPDEFYSVLRHGQMQEAATGLDDGTLHAVAQTFANPKAAVQRPPNGGAEFCSAKKPEVAESGEGTPASWPGFSADSGNTRWIDRPFRKTDLQRARLKWTFVIPDAAAGFWLGGANPVALANGRLFVANMNRWVYALDAQKGCAYWAFRADAAVRSGVAVDSGRVAFGDVRGNVYGLDEETGQLRWRHLADEQSFVRITGNVAAQEGRVVVPVSLMQEILTIHPERSCCTGRGSAAAYDIRSGEPLWQTFMIEQPLQYQGQTAQGVNRFGPSGVGLLAPPTIDVLRNRVFVTTGNQTTGPFVPESDAVVALNLETGAKQWVTTLAPQQFGGQDIYTLGCKESIDPTRSRCPPENPGPGDYGDRDFVAPAILVRQPKGGDVLIAGSKDGMVYALDPDNGKLIWELRVSKGGDVGGIMYGMASDGRVIYVPVTDVELPAAEVASSEHKSDASVPTRSPSEFLAAEVESSGHKSDGALNAIDLSTGRLLWRTAVPRDDCKNKENCLNGIASPPVVIGDVVIVGSMDGVLRAYEKKSGRQFWSFDAVREFTGINGFKGKGGGFGMGGAAIVGNMMYLSSGAGFAGGGINGNAILAFELPR